MRNWNPVVRSFFRLALSQGFTLHSIDNGDGDVKVSTVKDAVNEVVATDESHVYLNTPDGKKTWFYLVLGNEPEETICDYSATDAGDKLHEAFSAKWQGKPCPIKA